MPVSPQDFELYSRMTGTPLPSDAMSRMQMAPEVFQFTKNFAKKPNILEKTGNLIKSAARNTLVGAGMLASMDLENQERQRQELMRNEAAKEEVADANMDESPEQVADTPAMAKIRLGMEAEAQKQKNRLEIEDRRDARAERQKQKYVEKMKKSNIEDPNEELVDMEMKTGDDTVTTIFGDGRPSITESLPPAEKIPPQQPTTADSYGQDYIPNQSASNIVDRSIDLGSEMADESPTVASELSQSQDSQPYDSKLGFQENPMGEKKLPEVTELLGKVPSQKKVAAFFTRLGLDDALSGAGQSRDETVELIGDDSPLTDNVDSELDGGEDQSNVPTQKNLKERGQNTSATTDLSIHQKEMRRMDAEERRKKITPSEKQVNLSEESIRLGSKFGIPNKTDMEQIRKDPEFVAAQESMKPKSTAEKTDDFMAQFVEGARSDIVRGARGNKSLGVTRIPATNGDAQVGFVLANKPLDQSPKFATTYGFGVAPGAESLLDNQLNRDTFSSYMQRGMKEAQQGKRRQAGEIFEYLIPQQRIITGDARLGDIVM